MFVEEQDVTRVQERFLDPEKPPIHVSDMSLLIVSLTWGALLDPEVDSSASAALVDVIQEISRLLLRQNDTIHKFLVS